MSANGLFLLGFGIGFLIIGFYFFRKKRLIENIPTSPIRSLAMGQVEITGQVKCWENTFLISPFSQKDTVYYQYAIDELRSSGKNSHWVTIKQDTQCVHFLLRDNTGAVLVSPKQAKIDIPKSFEYQSDWRQDPPASIQRFLKRNNISFEGPLFGLNKTMRYREKIIQPGDQLYILGAAGDNPFVSDSTAQQGIQDVMIQQVNNHPFFISNKSEKAILSKYTILSSTGFTIGLILSVIGVYLLV